jgi:sulfate adenylyltransferase
MDNIITPYGGKLNNLLVESAKKRDTLKQAQASIQVNLTSKEYSDLIMLGIGAFSPLTGFMGEEDYKGVLEGMKLKSGLLWPIPITLAVSNETARKLKEGQLIALTEPANREIVGLMNVENVFDYDKEFEAKEVFGTTDLNHPGVHKLSQQGDVYLAGPVTVLSEGGYRERFPEYAWPSETREIFAEKGWSIIAAFQTRNPIHRSHEYLIKVALEICDGVLIHPLVGELKEGDIPADIRMKCYRAILEHYFPKDRVVLKVYPMEMRYAGPKEAVLHAIIRQNYGCTHLIVGRDHAGVGNYYGPFDAQNIFDSLESEDLKIKPLKMDWTFWCYKCSSMASPKTCPHSESDHLMISGNKLRQMLTDGNKPTEEFSRPEVLDILVKYYSSIK